MEGLATAKAGFQTAFFLICAWGCTPIAPSPQRFSFVVQLNPSEERTMRTKSGYEYRLSCKPGLGWKPGPYVIQSTKGVAEVGINPQECGGSLPVLINSNGSLIRDYEYLSVGEDAKGFYFTFVRIER
jgi:hypothetical protein